MRLTRDELELLESAAHLEGRTPNAYAYELVRAHLHALRSNTFVMTDLDNRREYERARAARGTTSIATARKSAGASSQSDSAG